VWADHGRFQIDEEAAAGFLGMWDDFWGRKEREDSPGV